MMWKRALSQYTKRVKVTQQPLSWNKWPSPTALQYAKSMSSSSSAPTTYDDVRIASTYNWFHELVIGQKLCPFAPPMDKDPSLMRVISVPEDATKKEAIALVRQQIVELMGEFPDGCPEVVSSPEDLPTDAVHETTLVILDLPFLQDFRDFVRFSWDLQEEAVAEYVSILQIVLFHPQATHQTYGSTLENAGDYTIRAPYPTVHLLREMDVMRAVQGGYPRLDTLPQRNQQKMIKQGLEHCQQRLEGCYVERKEE